MLALISVLFCLLSSHFHASKAAKSLTLKKWWFVGPFLIGKTEIDVDPLEHFSHLPSTSNDTCTRLKIIRRAPGCPTFFFSEVVVGGYVGWSKILATKDRNGRFNINVQFPIANATVNYNNLISGLNKMTVLEFQGWITTAFVVEQDGMYSIRCPSIHSYFIDEILYSGDVYSVGLSQSVYLTAGKHYFDIRLRAKGSLQFQVSIELEDTNVLCLHQMTRGNEATDILDGELPFSSSSWIQLPLTNKGHEWISELQVVITNTRINEKKVTVVTSPPQNSGIVDLAIPIATIAPMHTVNIPFQFRLQHTANPSVDFWWREYTSRDDPCLTFDVYFMGTEISSKREMRSDTSTVRLRCRHSLQSFVFTYLDHDGSVTHAAAILPRRARSVSFDAAFSTLSLAAPVRDAHSTCRDMQREGAFPEGPSGCPVLLTLSGVGVTARSQADSHKYKLNPREKDYTFGFEDMWILAPARDGAHNWEGTGYWTARTALEYLIAVTASSARLQAHPHQIVAGGHSRGGHGVLTLATHLPDTFQAIVTASGYPDRELYGDANILFDLDLQLGNMDPLLTAIHWAVLHEHDNQQTAGNLKYFDVFVRAGAEDRTVNPFFQRMIARFLQANQANVVLSEKGGADHWYWDFYAPEDGGVVFDPLSRSFIEDHAVFASSVSSSPMSRRARAAEAGGFTVESWNPATFESSHGVRILQMISRLKKAIIRVSSAGAAAADFPSQAGKVDWVFQPSNVRRFIVSAEFWRRFPCTKLMQNTDFEVCEAVSISIAGIVFIIAEVGDADIEFVYSAESLPEEATEECVASQKRKFTWRLASGGSGDSGNFPHGTRSRGSSSRQLAHSHGERRPYNYGPARQAFQGPFVIIVGTMNSTAASADRPSAADLLDAGRYLSAGHFSASSTVAPVLTDVQALAAMDSLLQQGTNLILVGGPEENSVSKFMVDADTKHSFSFPVQFLTESTPQDVVASFSSSATTTTQSTTDTSLLSFSFKGACTFSSKNQGIMFTFPLPPPDMFLGMNSNKSLSNNKSSGSNSSSDSNSSSGSSSSQSLPRKNRMNNIGLMVAADSKGSLQDVISYSFSSNTALTRGPFSNMYADYFITGPQFRGRGLGGLQGAGFWDNLWHFDPTQGWTDVDC